MDRVMRIYRALRINRNKLCPECQGSECGKHMAEDFLLACNIDGLIFSLEKDGIETL